MNPVSDRVPEVDSRPTEEHPKTTRIAFVLLVAALAGLFALRVWAAKISVLPGTPDSTNAAIVARNLLAGQGYSTNSIRYHVVPYRSVMHPEDAFELAYPTLAAAAMRVLGDSILSVWLPNILLLTLILPILVFLTARPYMSPPWALFASFLAAGSGVTWFVASSGLNDALCATFVLLGVRAAIRCIEEKSSSAFMFLGLVTGLGAMSKASTIPFLAPVVAFALLSVLKARGIRRAAMVSTVFALTAILVYSPSAARNLKTFGTVGCPVQRHLLPLRLAGALPQRYAFYLPPYVADAPAVPRLALGQYTRNVRYNARRFMMFFNRSLGPLALLGFFFGLRRRRSLPVLSLLAAAAALLWLSAIHHFENRYCTALAPSLAVATAFGCYEAARAVSERHQKLAAWCTPTAITVLATLFGVLQWPMWQDWAHSHFSKEAGQRRAAWSGIADMVRRDSPPDAVIMTGVSEKVAYTTGRGAITPSFLPLEGILTIARRYNATFFLAVGQPQSGEATSPLYEGEGLGPFALINTSPDGTARLYRILQPVKEP